MSRCAGEPHARFDGGELEKELLWLPIKAALGKPRDMSPVRPTARHLASSLPDRDPRFRNPNGVALKLANFAALDPSYPGVGMTRGGKRDAEVWDSFIRRPDELAAIAAQLRNGARPDGPRFPIATEDDEDDVVEGRLLFRQHRSRERNRKLIDRKKAVARAQADLACEVCGFDFEAIYGALGRDFIECHHLRPLSESGMTRTRLSDLALLCANCHRMAHRGRPWPSLDRLRSLVRDESGQ